MCRLPATLMLAILLPATTVAAPVKPQPKETTQERLSGIWELRADDGRSGRLILAPDGRLAATSAASDARLPDYEGQWTSISENGDRYVLEFGKSTNSPDSYRVTILLTCRDAFTVLEIVKGKSRIPEQNRFIRVARVAPKPP